jgi:hypothetical protein
MTSPPDIFYLVREGRISLQTGFCNGLPAKWFMETKGWTPCLGKQRGFPHFTKAGWEANKAKIKELYEEAIQNPNMNRGETWKDFEEYAQMFFKAVESSLIRKIKKLNNDLAQAKELLKTFK